MAARQSVNRPIGDQVAQLLELGAELGPAAGEIAKSLRRHPQQHTASGHLVSAGELEALGRGISTRQNNRPAPISRRGIGAGSKLEPLWNRFGTSNPLI